MKEVVSVGVANHSEKTMRVEDIKDWEPSKISYIGTNVYFKADETFYSMDTDEFKAIFGEKIKK